MQKFNALQINKINNRVARHLRQGSEECRGLSVRMLGQWVASTFRDQGAMVGKGHQQART